MDAVPTFDELESTVSHEVNFNINKLGEFDRIPVDKSRLNSVDFYMINSYTGSGYKTINEFLYKRDFKLSARSQIVHDPFIKLLMQKFNKEQDESNDEYMTKIFYYYFINLFTTIQKYPMSLTGFSIYRGSATHYLNEDPTKTFYTNSFMSTSYIPNIGFGHIKYTFYVHPMCNYINLTTVSNVKGECEVLFSPYHRYTFIKKTRNVYYYVLLPLDIDIPGDIETFIPWKDTLNTIVGGLYNSKKLKSAMMTKVISKMNQPKTVTDNLNTSMVGTNAVGTNAVGTNAVGTSVAGTSVAGTSVVGTNAVGTNAAKANGAKPNTSEEEKPGTFMDRVTMKINSFGGRPITEDEQKMKDELIAFLDK